MSCSSEAGWLTKIGAAMAIPYLPMARIEADVAVVGAGAAGLYVALTAAREGARVALVSASSLAETASYWAQGGLAAALGDDDDPALHLADTELAGRGIVRTSAAELVCAEAADRVRELEALGVSFDADRRGRLSLGLEGGHSRRRVVHAGGSATGRRLVRQLSALAAGSPEIEVIENARARALSVSSQGRCVGLALEDGRTISASATILCTGGAAALWSRTTNPPGSVGSGLLLAHDAGADLADLEFVQFHPTAVIGVRGREGYLVTEAVRGEGGLLLDAAGERFVDELAPRDEVARAIRAQMLADATDSVQLDMRQIDPALFPNVVSALAEAGLDATRETIPVAPASHYVMGGIVCDLAGRSSVSGLSAVGEAACTGLHGANRLGSNSLSECFVFGARAARTALEAPGDHHAFVEPAPGAPQRVPRSTQNALWSHAGLVRDASGLSSLLEDPHPLARMIAACALHRTESRGAHGRADFPATDPAWERVHTVIGADGKPRSEVWN